MMPELWHKVAAELGCDCGVRRGNSAKHQAVCKAHSAVLLSLAALMAFTFRSSTRSPRTDRLQTDRQKQADSTMHAAAEQP